MTISMHSASVPVFTTMLGNLSKWLDRAEVYAAERKFEPVVLLGARLAPDMLPFTRQVQIACDGAKFCVARLAGVESPRFEDNESTVAELRDRIAKTIAYVNSIPAAQIDGSEDRDITIPRREGSTVMKGEPYLKHFVLPNLFFHVTTAYALLRHNGVPLGKGDYLGLTR
jgi:uncharacterized protein